MRHLLPLILVLAACSSMSPGTKVNIPEPELQIVQLVGPGEQTFPDGNFEVKYQLQIANRSDIPITLVKLEIRTSNPAGGAYTLRSPFTYFFNRIIAPKSMDTVDFWARAVGYGHSMRETEPVTMRGVAYYQTPRGYYNQPFVRELSQYGE
jgi:hypothetical protein